MNVNLHISTLTTMIRKIGSMLVELSGFETANPDPNEKRTNAMSFLTLTDKDGVRIRVRFRENLNMGIVESMYIQNNSFYDNLLASEYQEQTQHLESDQENEISTILNQLKKDWDFFDKKYNERFKKDVYIPKNILIILKIYEQYINDFTKKDSNHLKALQIMILAGMRGKRLVQLNKMLNMKV